MKTLVIHPFDPTTQFLSKIYKGKGWTLITQNISKSRIRQAIKDHDRIVLLGHGTERGLIGFEKNFIDSKWVQQLREKKIVAIWCNADKFVEKYDLKGFYTGMIISEYEEALIYGVLAKGTEKIDESNRIFADAIHNSIDHKDMLSKTYNLYNAEFDNNIIDFNKGNLYERS